VPLVSAVQKNAAAKLNVIYQNLEYLELSETRIRRADLTAFAVAVVVEGRTYVGVGKTKKEARCEAAEKALRHLRLWTDADEESKRMMLFGIDKEDPVEMVMRLRTEAGLPPYSQDWDTPSDPGFSSSWDNGHLSGTGDDGRNHMFDSHGPPPAHFQGPDFRPPMFLPRGRFDEGPRGPRSPGPRAFVRDYTVERPSYAGFGREYDRRDEIRFSKGYDGVGPNQASLGRGRDTAPVSLPPKGRGNTSVTGGISRGQLYPQRGFGHVLTTESKKVAVASVPERVKRYVPPIQDKVVHTRPANNQPWNRPVIQSSKAGNVPPRPSNNVMTGRLPLSTNIAPTRNTAPQTGLAANFNYVPVSSSASSALRTSVPACSPWNPMTSSLSYAQQQRSTPVTTHQSFPTNPAISTTVASGAASVGEQYNMNNTWSGAAQADYFAYYNNYLQNMGVLDTNSFVNMSVPGADSNLLPTSSGAVQTNDATYASQAMAYANDAATYYSTLFYAAGGYADPSQSQLSNYLYPYTNNKPT